jgi:hypothetical protein
MPEWEPDEDEPQTERERYWFHHGQAIAYAAVMTEIEHMAGVSL